MRDLYGTAFVGRRVELEQLAQLTATDARLITIVGPPGTGKSRLAHQAARHLEPRQSLELAEVADERALDERVDDVLAWASAEARAPLLVLDNSEHLVTALAARLAGWLRRAPRLRLLVTSRERLRVPGEQVLELGPLSLPPLDATELAQILASEAGELFCARCAALELAPGQARVLAELLHRLDGIPLALELAAVRTTVLDLAQLRARLEQRFELLAIGPRGAASRQATLWGAIDWSWSLLAPTEQDALAQCAVFRGSFALAAAEAVLEVPRGHPDEPAPTALDLLQALTEKSLLQVVRAPGPAGARYRLYDSIRDYATARLAGSPTRAAVESRHAQYFDRVGRTLGSGRERPRAGGLVARIALEMDDLLAAFERGLTAPGSAGVAAARAVEYLARFEHLLARQARTGAFPLLRRAAEHAVAQVKVRAADDPALRAALLCFVACTCSAVGRWAVAQRLFERALEQAEAAAEPAARGAALCALGATLLSNDHDERHAALAEALAIAREAGDRALEASALIHLGALYLEQAMPEEAITHWDSALEPVRQLGWSTEEALLRADRAAAHLEQGRWDAARRELDAALALHQRAGDARLAAGTVGNLGCVAHEQGALDDAAAHYRRAIDELAAVGARRMEGLFLAYLGGLEAARGRLAEARTALDDAAARAGEYGERVDADIVACHRARLAVEEARLAAAQGDLARASELRAAALALTRGPLPTNLDLRAARRLLGRALGDATYVVAQDGTWFCPPNRREVSLARRHVLRRLLAALVTERAARTSARTEFGAARTELALSAERLIAAAWPDEQMSPPAALNRLHVALTTLRNLGLRDLLLRDGDGYLLAPDVALEVRPGPCSPGG